MFCRVRGARKSARPSDIEQQRAVLRYARPIFADNDRAPRPVKIDLTALAFRYDLAALDRRLRADTVSERQSITSRSTNCPTTSWTDSLMRLDMPTPTSTGLKLFEGVADDLREKAFARKEGTVNYAAQR